jgi:hypothetical protein
MVGRELVEDKQAIGMASPHRGGCGERICGGRRSGEDKVRVGPLARSLLPQRSKRGVLATRAVIRSIGTIQRRPMGSPVQRSLRLNRIIFLFFCIIGEAKPELFGCPKFVFHVRKRCLVTCNMHNTVTSSPMW